MRILLDTNVLIWLLQANPKLSHKWRMILDDPSNELWVSMASLWEMMIKIALGKLRLSYSFTEFVLRAQMIGRVQILPISLDHIAILEHLPHHHRDPFDRLIIAQAISEGLTIATSDETFGKYDVGLLE